MQFLLVTILLLGAAVAVQSRLFATRNDDDLCIGKPNGVKVATGTCNSFVTCSNGVAIMQSCQQGQLFNNNTSECDWAANVDCVELVGAPQGPAPSCQGRIGQMLRNPYDCSSFYFCEHNAALLFHCDTGLYFDPNISNCNWKENVQCRIDTVPINPDAPVRD